MSQQTAPEKPSIADQQDRVTKEENVEDVNNVDTSALDEENSRLERQIKNNNIKKAIANAPTEVGAAVIGLQQVQRRKLEGQRWVENSGDRVGKEVSRLDGKIAKLNLELKEMNERKALISKDGGQSFGKAMIAEAEGQLAEAKKETVETIKKHDVKLSIDDILDVVK